MPLVTTPERPGRLGLLLPPMPPLLEGTTHSATIGETFGSTAWVTALAVGAEKAGASGVWASDHLFWGRPAAECMTTLAVAAAATQRPTVGSCVLQLPLRAPAAVAKQATTLQALSGGRFVLGVGVGSHAAEYELAGADFSGRGKALDAGIAKLRAAWRTAEGAGPYRMEPAAPVPVWVGGSSPAALRRAAALADGWVPLFLGPEQFARSLGRLHELAEEAGRRPGEVVPAVVMVATVGEDAARARADGTGWLSSFYGIPPKAFDRHLVAGTADHCAAVASAYVEAGAAQVIVMVAADDALGQFRDIAAARRSASTVDTCELAEVGA